MPNEGRLVVLLDGRPLPDAAAHALWVRFSAYMGEHEGDFAGFAQQEGFASAKAESRGGKAFLVLKSRS
jgi:hypothetical protein